MKNLLKYIAVFGALTLVVFLNVENVNGQCTNTYHYGSAVAPTDNVTITISTYQEIGEYAEITGVVAGETYTVTFSRSPGFITVRSGTYNGTVVASGLGPITFTASTSGTYYVHFNPDNNCGTWAWASYTTTITCISCPPPPPTPQDCEGATMVCDDDS